MKIQCNICKKLFSPDELAELNLEEKRAVCNDCIEALSSKKSEKKSFFNFDMSENSKTILLILLVIILIFVQVAML